MSDLESRIAPLDAIERLILRFAEGGSDGRIGYVPISLLFPLVERLRMLAAAPPAPPAAQPTTALKCPRCEGTEILAGEQWHTCQQCGAFGWPTIGSFRVAPPAAAERKELLIRVGAFVESRRRNGADEKTCSEILNWLAEVE